MKQEKLITVSAINMNELQVKVWHEHGNGYTEIGKVWNKNVFGWNKLFINMILK